MPITPQWDTLPAANVRQVHPATGEGGTDATTREYAISTSLRPTVTASSAATALPTLGANREIMLMPNTRCWIATGTGGVTASAGAGSVPLAADERWHLRVPVGHTHIAAIRDGADGHLSICAVAS